MEMSQYIFSILRKQLNIIFSWGFHNPVAIDNGIIFRVNGFKHQGWVAIKYDTAEDLFVVELYDIYQTKTQDVESIYAEDLIEVIDGLVEKVDNYKDEVLKWVNSEENIHFSHKRNS